MGAKQQFDEMCAGGAVSGPSSEAEILAAEAELKVSFPQQYRDFLERFGAGLFAGIEVYGLPDPEKNDPPLWQDVVEVTKQLRDWGQAGTENPEYVPISEDGTGVYFFLDTAASPGTKVVAMGPGVERVVSSDLFAFFIDLSERRIKF